MLGGNVRLMLIRTVAAIDLRIEWLLQIHLFMNTFEISFRGCVKEIM